MRKELLSWAQVILGSAVTALATEAFLVPNDVFDGGVTGIAMIASHFFPLGLGALVALISLPFLAVGARYLGRRFVLKTALGIAVFSVVAGLLGPVVHATYDVFLGTVFGGLVLGIGDGLVLRGGGCLDGTEIVAILLSRRSELSVGQVVLAINAAVYVAVGMLFGFDQGMYSLVMFFITSRMIDFVEVGWNTTKSVFVVTEDGTTLAHRIFERLGRSATILRGRGMVSGACKDVVYCVVTRAELFELRSLVAAMPGTSFTTITDVSEVVGEHHKS